MGLMDLLACVCIVGVVLCYVCVSVCVIPMYSLSQSNDIYEIPAALDRVETKLLGFYLF